MNRIAVIGIIVEEPQEVEKLNQLLHEYGSYIIGRMGIPYRERKIHVISIAMDAPQDTINALTGKIGRLLLYRLCRLGQEFFAQVLVQPVPVN